MQQNGQFSSWTSSVFDSLLTLKASPVTPPLACICRYCLNILLIVFSCLVSFCLVSQAERKFQDFSSHYMLKERSFSLRTRGWAVNRVHNSRQPLDHLFCTLWPCDLDLWPFDIILIEGQGLVMDCPCAKFGDISFIRFGFIMRTNTVTQTHRVTDAAKRFTPATVVGVSNYLGYGLIFYGFS